MSKVPHKMNSEAVSGSAEARAASEMVDDKVATEKPDVADDNVVHIGEVLDKEPEASKDGEGGRRARTTFTPKLFLPERKVLALHCLDKPKGTIFMLGRVYGTVTDADFKKGQLPDGTPSEMPRLQGVFETMNYVTGEMGEAITAYIPKAYSQPLVIAFMQSKGAEKLVEIDVDIGVESTGRMQIPYEWVVVAHIEGEKSQRMVALRNRRGSLAQLRAQANARLMLTNG